MAGRKRLAYLLLMIAMALPTLADQPGAPDKPDVSEIVRRSIQAAQSDWKAFPNYTHLERSAKTKGGSDDAKTFEVLMIDGSSYNRLISIDGKKLPPALAEREVQKLREVIEERANQSPRARRERIAAYQKKRRRMLDMMRDMTKALNFKLVGEERVEGYDTYVLDATPRPGYRPTSRETKVLTGARGRIWIEKQNYNWVKADAVVMKSVPLVWYLAKVLPGTRLLLEQAPIGDGIWEPKHFHLDVKASFLWMDKSFVEDDTYWDYRPLLQDPPSGSLRDPAQIPPPPDTHPEASQYTH